MHSTVSLHNLYPTTHLAGLAAWVLHLALTCSQLVLLVLPSHSVSSGQVIGQLKQLLTTVGAKKEIT